MVFPSGTDAMKLRIALVTLVPPVLSMLVGTL